MKKLLARLKKVADEQGKYSKLADARRRELMALGYEIRQLMGAKLDALTGSADSPLQGYKWVGHFREVGRSIDTRYMAVVITAKKKRLRAPDPLTRFFGEALTAAVAYDLCVPLRKGIDLYETRDSWEIHFGERGHKDPTLAVSDEQITAYIKERKLRVKISHQEWGDYQHAKKFIAECDDFMKLIGQEIT